MRATAALVVAAFMILNICAPRVKCETVPGSVLEIKPKQESFVASVAAAAASYPRHNFLLGVAQVGLQHENGTHCGKELESLLKAVHDSEMWSLKVIDSFGTPPKSFYWGNYFWFGNSLLCSDLNSPYTVSFSTEYKRTQTFDYYNVTSPFPLRFTVVYLRYSSPFVIDTRCILPFKYLIHAGLCLPQSCSTAALQRYTDEYFQLGEFVTQRDFKLQLQAVESRVPELSWRIFEQTGTIILIVMTLTVVLLTVLADVLYHSKNKLQLQQQQHTKTVISTTMVDMSPTADVAAAAPTDAVKSDAKSSILEELLLCFRFSDNVQRALEPDHDNSKTNSNFLSAVAGFRTIICMWVAIFHVYYYSLFTSSNTPQVFAKMEGLLMQPLLQGTYYVDVFFTISALLLVYHFLGNESQLKAIRQSGWVRTLKLFWRLLFQRYMRLAPVVIVTILHGDVIYDVLNMFTPFNVGIHSGIYCKRRWWQNLLFINNLADMRDICCSWTWYLGCEMQFFVLFTAILFVYAKNKRLGQIVFAAVSLGFVVGSWLCNYNNGITFQLDVMNRTLNALYVKPWVRINPYIGGALCGWLLHRYRHRSSEQQNHQQLQSHHKNLQQPAQQQQQQQLHEMQQQQFMQQHQQPPLSSLSPQNKSNFGGLRTAFWLLCMLLLVVTNFMSYWRTAPIWLVATIMSFGKLFFALCVGGVIILCACGHGGRLNELLSASIFQFFNKFCFSMYLVEPLVVMLFFGLGGEAMNVTEAISVMQVVGAIGMSMVAAFLVAVLVELPMQRVTSRLLRK